jgi:hypothetical protein
MEEITSPVLQALLTNHCAAHTRSILRLRWKMEGQTCLQSGWLSVTVPSYNNPNIIRYEIR